VTGFVDGLMQALVPAHVIAMISAALLAARAKLWPSMGFVAPLAAGLAAGLAALALGVGETPTGDALLAAALLGGLATAAALKVPSPVVGSTAFIVGFALGLDSPPDAVLLRDAILGLAGTVGRGGDVICSCRGGGGAAGARVEWNRAAGRGLLDRGDGDPCSGAAMGVLSVSI
jgi:hypothetical protein